MNGIHLLVTGSHGLIGEGLCQRLEAEGISFTRVTRAAPPASRPGAISVNWPGELATIDYTPYTAVVHLAYRRNDGSRSAQEEIDDHLTPVRNLLSGISASNPDCRLIVLSSQSAGERAQSAYGLAKWKMEQAVRASTVKSVIITPGLVVGEGGLSGSLRRILQRLPCIGIPDGERLRVQPVMLDDLIELIVKLSCGSFETKAVDIALPGRSFPDFVRSLAALDGNRTFVFSVPLPLFRFALRVAERLIPKFPVSERNLLGLLGGRTIDPAQSEAIFGRKLREMPIELSRHFDDPLQRECSYLYRSLFGASASDALLKEYQRAHLVRPHLAKAGKVNLPRIIERELDVEAIEFALRRRRSPDLTLLSEKFELLSYLAEFEPKAADLFVRGRPAWLRGFLSLAWVTVRSVYKLLLGTALIRRHSLVEAR